MTKDNQEQLGIHKDTDMLKQARLLSTAHREGNKGVIWYKNQMEALVKAGYKDENAIRQLYAGNKSKFFQIVGPYISEAQKGRIAAFDQKGLQRKNPIKNFGIIYYLRPWFGGRATNATKRAYKMMEGTKNNTNTLTPKTTNPEISETEPTTHDRIPLSQNPSAYAFLGDSIMVGGTKGRLPKGAQNRAVGGENIYQIIDKQYENINPSVKYVVANTAIANTMGRYFTARKGAHFTKNMTEYGINTGFIETYKGEINRLKEKAKSNGHKLIIVTDTPCLDWMLTKLVANGHPASMAQSMHEATYGAAIKFLRAEAKKGEIELIDLGGRDDLVKGGDGLHLGKGYNEYYAEIQKQLDQAPTSPQS